MIRSKLIVDTFLVAFLILSTGGLAFVYNRNLMYLIYFIFTFLILITSTKKPKKIIFNSCILSFITVLIIYSINFIFAVNTQAIEKFLFNILVTVICLFVIYHFLNNRSLNRFLKILYICLQLLLIHSILNFIAFFFVKDNLQTITSIFHECQTFYNFFFYDLQKSTIQIFDYEICRNQGLFWEPGILQAYLNLLFFLEAFYFKKRNFLLLVISISVISTYSTSGLTILIVQIIVYIISEIKRSKVLFITTLSLLIPLMFLYLNNIESKFKGDYESSFQKRLFDLTQPFFIALQNPLTGVGLDIIQFQEIRKEFYFKSKRLNTLQDKFGIESKSKTTEKGSSNSVMFLLASLGFPFSILFIYFSIKQNIFMHKKSLFTFVFFLIVMSQPLLLRPFFFTFIISGMVNIYSKLKTNMVQ